MFIPIVLLAAPWRAGAQVNVTITPPPLVAVGQVIEKVSQEQVEAYIGATLGTLEVQASQLIGQSLSKPGLFAGMSDAVTLPVLSLGRPPWDSTRFSLAFGTWAGLETDTFDSSVLVHRAGNLDPDGDYRMGASALPVSLSVAYMVLPGEWAVSVGAFGGYSRLDLSPSSLTTWAAGGSVSLTWHRMTFSAGAGWVENLYSTSVTVSLAPQVVDMTLADLLTDEVTITATPRVGLNVDTRALGFPVQVSTELNWLRTWNLSLAAGVVVSQGWSSVGLSGTNPVTLTSRSGALGHFMGNTAQVTVSGSVGGSTGISIDPFVGITPSWSVGPSRVGIPLVWRYPGGLAGSLSWGMAL